MKKLSIVNPDAKTVHEEIGISNERSETIRKEITALLEDHKGVRHAEALCLVHNKYENETECAYAVYMLVPTEAGVEIHEKFKLPQAELDKEVAGLENEK